MKKFETPEIDVQKFGMADVITTSPVDPDENAGEEDIL